jgi:hypothetical protein
MEATKAMPPLPLKLILFRARITLKAIAVVDSFFAIESEGNLNSKKSYKLL